MAQGQRDDEASTTASFPQRFQLEVDDAAPKGGLDVIATPARVSAHISLTML